MLNVENFETLIVAIGNRLMLRRLVVLPVVFERNKQRRYYYRLRSPRTRKLYYGNSSLCTCTVQSREHFGAKLTQTLFPKNAIREWKHYYRTLAAVIKEWT